MNAHGIEAPGRRGRTPGLMLAAALGLALLALPATASARDRNHDRIPDRWERNHSLSLHVKQTHRDQDRDQLVNRKEFLAGMDPHDADSDDDGVDDADEGAGTIVSFDRSTGELTIDDMVGGSATALVTEATEVSCDNGDDHGDEDSDGEGGDHQGDDDGAHDDGQSGDDGLAPATTADSADSGAGDGDDLDEHDDEHACSAADLVPGATVQEAELELTADGLVWEEIELLR